MASEYSVNIRLNTSKVRKDLKDIRTDINNLNKAQSKGSKNKLSETEKELKLQNQSLRLQNQGLGLSLKSLPLAKKGVNLGKIELGIAEGIAKAEKFEFDLARKSLLLTDQEIKKEQILLKANESITKSKTTQLRIQKQMASPIGGTRFMMGSPAQKAFSGGPRSPIGGSLTLPGSPRFLANQARQAKVGLKGFDFQSALISGGFPLLFGQGPAGAVAGGLGGGVGGMFGQMGGFAGGIAATAALQSITTTLNSIRDLGNALAKPTENIKLLTEKLGLANTPTGELAAKLEKLGLTSSASALLIEKFTEITGKTPSEIQQISRELNHFNSEMAQFGLKMGIIVAEVFTPLIALVNRLPLETLSKLVQLKVDPAGTIVRGIGSTLPQSTKDGFNNQLVKRLPFLFQNEGTSSSNGSLKLPFAEDVFDSRMLEPLRQAIKLEKDRLNISSEEFSLKQQKFTLENLKSERDILNNEINKKNTDILQDQLKLLNLKIQKQEAIIANSEAMLDPARQLSNIIAQDIGNGIKGLIKGTQSLGDVLNNVVDKLLDASLNMAIFGNIGGGSVTGGLLKAIGFADGGRPPVGRASIVGERGPELFVPDRAGTIIPNSAMGSTNIVVNVDASGSSVEGDDNGQQFGEALATAIQLELVKQKRSGGLLA